MTRTDFDESMEVEMVDPRQNRGDRERENLQMPGIMEKFSDYVKDPYFLRGLLYTTLPVSICTFVLIMAYRKDLMSARSSTSTIFKTPVYLIILFAGAVPFIAKHIEIPFMMSMLGFPEKAKDLNPVKPPNPDAGGGVGPAGG